MNTRSLVIVIDFASLIQLTLAPLQTVARADIQSRHRDRDERREGSRQSS
jgi:hypothetical protein